MNKIYRGHGTIPLLFGNAFRCNEVDPNIYGTAEGGNLDAKGTPRVCIESEKGAL